MNPPYEITTKILHLVNEISEKVGAINIINLNIPSPTLRKENRIKTIQSSLAIEGNTLSVKQITAVLEGKRIVAPNKDILEVKNAIKVYENLEKYNPNKLSDLCKAHKVLMKNLDNDAGKLRTKSVGIVKGDELAHLAPSGSMVKSLMNNLFSYLKKSDDLTLIKSCVFHYELEFIHPFMDGNGRMGRLWQTLVLSSSNSVFSFLPIESLIKQRQDEYYNALGKSDKIGQSTPFIEFMLVVISDALSVVLGAQNKTITNTDRIEIFRLAIKENTFGRKEYLSKFKTISTATASRDLKVAVEKGVLKKIGTQNKTTYQFC